jgi:hypothetical protein
VSVDFATALSQNEAIQEDLDLSDPADEGGMDNSPQGHSNGTNDQVDQVPSIVRFVRRWSESVMRIDPVFGHQIVQIVIDWAHFQGSNTVKSSMFETVEEYMWFRTKNGGVEYVPVSQAHSFSLFIY